MKLHTLEACIGLAEAVPRDAGNLPGPGRVVDRTPLPRQESRKLMNADLNADLLRQRVHLSWLRDRARELGTNPGAECAWELVHEWAGIVAKTESRLQQQRWAA